ncbi:MAG: thiamine phosphate synthase [Pseudomonadota bacterium]|nr:thiamine phosphate synthase [Pseudomonadota bacterium]
MAACRLYLISPPAINLSVFKQQLAEAFSGGDVASFQLRLKGVSDDDLLEAAEALLPICHKHNAAFILNDRPDLALKCHADGVHIGQDDGSIKAARAKVGEAMVIGASCHDSRHLAMVAGEEGADYVAFGAFYPTKSKNPEAMKRWGVPKPEILTWWQENTVLPCVAIGGITPANCAPLVRAGADFIAAITAVWEHPQGSAKAVENFNKAIKDASKTS